MRHPESRRIVTVQVSLRAVATAAPALVLALLLGCGGTGLPGSSVDEKVLAAAALGQRDADENVPTLLQAARVEPEMVQVESITALGRIGTPRAIEALGEFSRAEARTVRIAVAQALSDVKPESYADAAKVLAAMGRDALPRGAGDDPHRDVRRAVTTSLAVVRQPAGLDFLLDRALHDTDENIRNAAVKTLGRLKDPRPIDGLADIYHHDTEKNRAWAIEAIGEIGDPRGTPVVLEALADADRITRGKAAWSLMQLEGAAAVPRLEEALAREEDDMAAVRLAHALALLGRRDHTIPRIEQILLLARSEFARAEAGRALAEVGRCESLVAVDRAFREDRDGLVRKEAGGAARKLLDRCPADVVRKLLGNAAG